MTRMRPAVLLLLLACAHPSGLKKELSPLAWMEGDWSCRITSLDSGAIEEGKLQFFPELGGAWLGGKLVIPGRGPGPLFELVSHLGLDRDGRWTRVDVDVSGQVKLLRADAAGDSTLWQPAVDGDFRERIDRHGGAGLQCMIEGREKGEWVKQIRFDCSR